MGIIPNEEFVSAKTSPYLEKSVVSAYVVVEEMRRISCQVGIRGINVGINEQEICQHQSASVPAVLHLFDYDHI